MSFKAMKVYFVAALIPVYATGQCLSNLESLPSYNTKSPIRLNTFKTIPANTSTPIRLFSGLFDFLTVVNRGFGLDAIANEAIDKSYITGGVLCDKKYKFNKIYFSINQNNIFGFGRSGNTINGLRSPIEATAIYYDPKYSSIEKAVGKPGAIVQVSNPVLVGLIPNPLFIPFQSLLLSGALRKVNSTVQFPCPFVYLWFDALSFNPNYYAYIGSIRNPITGKLYPGAINILPVAFPSFLSFGQFAALRNVLGTNGKPLETISPIFPQGNRPVYFGNDGFKQQFIPF